MEQPGYNTIKQQDIDYGKGETLSPAGSRNTVFKALWTSPLRSTEVAVKSCNQFKEEEVKILAALQHKNIIKFHGVVKLDFPPDAYVIVTEYAEKGSLYKIIDQNRDNWSVYRRRVWMKWAREGAEGLDYIHQKGYQHGDVKSPNFVITGDNAMKICDFGTARQHVYTVSTYSVRGSWPWMAPEAMGVPGKSVNPKVTTKADVFSFAVVLWELFTGQIPFPGLSQLEIYKTVAEKKKRLDIPEEFPIFLGDLLRECWNPDYKHRPSMKEVLAVLFGLHAASLSDMDRCLNSVARKLRSEEWFALGTLMGFSAADFDACKTAHPHSLRLQITSMLVGWRNQQYDDKGTIVHHLGTFLASDAVGRPDLRDSLFHEGRLL